VDGPRRLWSRDAHKIRDEVIGTDRVAFTELCEYPDENLVFSPWFATLNDGRIERQVELQTRDG
jgi:hypothetical protein